MSTSTCTIIFPMVTVFIVQKNKFIFTTFCVHCQQALCFTLGEFVKWFGVNNNVHGATSGGSFDAREFVW